MNNGLYFTTAETGYGAATADKIVRDLWSNPAPPPAILAAITVAHAHDLPELERQLRASAPKPKGPHPPTKVSKAAVGYAIVRQGRWVVGCPFCQYHYQFAHRSDPRFFCCDCGNAPVKGQWVAVQWIDNPQDVETELLKRTDPFNQNWEWGESIGDLVMENAENGVSRLVIAREMP